METVLRSHPSVRAWLPVRTYPISSGVKGGVAGSLAMAFFGMCLRDTESRRGWYTHQFFSPQLSMGIHKTRPTVYHSMRHVCDCFRPARPRLHSCRLARRPMLPISASRDCPWRLSFTQCCVGDGLHDPRLLNPLLRAISTGSWFVVSQMALESLLEMCRGARRASRRGRTGRLLCAQELKLMAALHHEKTGERRQERSHICV